MNSTAETTHGKSCKDVVEDMHDIIAQINRYFHMKATGSVIDIFFYIERSVRAKALCQQIASSGDSGHSYQQELDSLHKTVKARWQHDLQLISTPVELHQYLKDDGTASLHMNKVIL